MRKLIVGEVEVTALTDVEGPFFRLSQLFPGVRADQWGPYLERYPWAFADAETLYGRVGSYLLRSPGHVVLVDTGIGPGAMGMRGRLIEDLERNGADPDDVDTVFLTHLHGDHVGWSLDPDAGSLAGARELARLIGRGAGARPWRCDRPSGPGDGGYVEHHLRREQGAGGVHPRATTGLARGGRDTV